MQHFLNLTLPLKQDATSQTGVTALVKALEAEASPVKKQIEVALTKSQIVHFARFVLIGRQYLQVITTYDGSEDSYADFFFNELNEVFQKVYEFVEGAPIGANFTLDNFRTFNTIPAHQPTPFFLYSANPDKTVKTIKGW